jgi:ubiquinone biosynthesis protein
LRQRYSPRRLVKTLRHKLPGWLEQLPEIPDALIRRLDTPLNRTPRHVPPPRRPRRRWQWPLALLLIAASLGAGLPELRQELEQLPWPSWVGLGAAALLLLSRR